MDFPVFNGTQKQKVEQIIDWLLKNIKPRRWTREEFKQKIFSRSPEQIVKEGHVLYNMTCADVGAVATELLLANGFEPAIVLDKHGLKGKEGIHLTVEMLVDGKPSHLRITGSQIKLLPGNIIQSEKRSIVIRKRITHSQAQTPYFSLFGIQNTADLKRVVKAKELSIFEAAVKKSNSRMKRAIIMSRRALFRTRRTIRRAIKK